MAMAPRGNGKHNITLHSARELFALGWALLPIRYQQKAPIGDDWQKPKILKPEDVERAFGGSEQLNIGLLLGEPSGNKIDCDLDCPEAVELAPHFLPATAIFGRPHN